MAGTGKSKILVIGGTGYIGKFIVQASVAAAHPTFLFIRNSTLSDPDPSSSKSTLLHQFRDSGVIFLVGDLYDHDSLVKAIKQVDVVISAVGFAQLHHQHKILSAIKEAGNIKRFFPSEFGNDVDRVHAVEPAKSVFNHKAQFRRLVEASGVPYTYVSSNLFARIFIKAFGDPEVTSPPSDKVVILGDGNTKAAYNKEEDIATYTIRAVDDPRTLNKILYIRPSTNTISTNDLVLLWEKKIGKKLERVYVPEEQVLKNIQEAAPPLNLKLGIWHSIYVKGDQANFAIEPWFGVEASEIYSDVRYATVDEIIHQCL